MSLAEILLLLRWLHLLFGTIWIGLLYASNLRRSAAGPKPGEAAVLEQPGQGLLRSFPWSAGGTVLFGGAYLFLVWGGNGVLRFAATPYGVTIVSGSVLGLTMFVNALLFWVIRRVPRRSSGREPARAVLIERRATLATRTNVVLSVPMLFFMAAASHYALFRQLGSARLSLWYAAVAAAVVLVELNAFVGLEGFSKRPLATVRAAVGSGFALWAMLFAIGRLLTARAS